MELSGQGVAVFCGASAGDDPAFRAAAHALGHHLAVAGATLVYGGASVGTMGALAQGALGAGGRVIGVIPQPLVDRELAHRGLSELCIVASMHERKALMSARCSAYVVLPGGFGTLDELFEVLTWRQLGLHHKPVILANLRGFWAPLLGQLELANAAGFVRSDARRHLIEARDVDEIMSHLRSWQPPRDLTKAVAHAPD